MKLRFNFNRSSTALKPKTTTKNEIARIELYKDNLKKLNNQIIELKKQMLYLNQKTTKINQISKAIDNQDIIINSISYYIYFSYIFHKIQFLLVTILKFLTFKLSRYYPINFEGLHRFCPIIYSNNFLLVRHVMLLDSIFISTILTSSKNKFSFIKV